MVNMNAFDKAMKAALSGPEAKKVKVDKHEFNVKKATTSGDRVSGRKVKGQLSHCLALRDDDQIYYECKIQAGQMVSIEQINIRIDESWMNKIARDIWVELKDVIVEALKNKGTAGDTNKGQFELQRLVEEAEDVKKRIFEESKKLLDGSWRGEAYFLILNIVGRHTINEAQTVYRQTRPPTKKPPTRRDPRPTKPPVRDHRTKEGGRTQVP